MTSGQTEVPSKLDLEPWELWLPTSSERNKVWEAFRKMASALETAIFCTSVAPPACLAVASHNSSQQQKQKQFLPCVWLSIASPGKHPGKPSQETSSKTPCSFLGAALDEGVGGLGNVTSLASPTCEPLHAGIWFIPSYGCFED